jgi:hypothetical protein
VNGGGGGGGGGVESGGDGGCGSGGFGGSFMDEKSMRSAPFQAVDFNFIARALRADLALALAQSASRD